MTTHFEEEMFPGFGSRAIHAGQDPDPHTGAVCVPITLSSTFAQKSPGVLYSQYEYSRSSNPTRVALENCLASLEHGKYGCAFATGSAATMTILHMLSHGSHVICGDDVYGGTNRYFSRVAGPAMDLKVSFIDFTEAKNLENEITDNTKMIWLETPTNPTLKVLDIERTVEIAKAKNILVVVDNTFATPYFQNPLEIGADIVVHSATKYLNGHSDVVLGLAATNSEKIYERLRFLQNAIGATPSPFDCYMTMRGMKTLHLRMREHAKNAMAIATKFEGHPKIDKVIYPGLKSHPQHEIASKQMQGGFGGMVTIVLKGGEKEARTFLENIKLITLAESLGAVESLAEYPVVMTHAAVPEDQRAVLGISHSLIRISVGIEEEQDLINDITQALDHIQ